MRKNKSPNPQNKATNRCEKGKYKPEPNENVKLFIQHINRENTLNLNLLQINYY